MAISLDSRIWLAAHLFYPNSSQAFDVYQTLFSETEDSIRKNKINLIFKKLNKIVEKIPAVHSNQAFHVFGEEQIDVWRKIYKQINKDQMVIFIGYFVFDLELDKIAALIKVKTSKVRLMFYETFKKTFSTDIKLSIPNKIKFKKVNEEKISFLYTKENLIDFCLNKLSEQESIKVNKGLQLYPELQSLKLSCESIVLQMKNLMERQQHQIIKPLIQISETLSSPQELFSYTKLLTQNRTLVASAGITLLFGVLVVFRPSWIQQMTQKSKDQSVVLSEVKPKQSVNELFEEPQAKMNLNEVPVNGGKNAEQAKPKEALALADNTKTSSNPTTASKNVTEQVKTETTTRNVALNTTVSKKAGGLYRGVLTVTDINEVSPKITEKLVDIGGKKAGEVELGWKKSDGLAYYHFTLPENNIEAMKEFLKNFGSLQIQFENHPRLMPAGVKRLIIEVKERE